jgi:hypothetical protein
LCDEQADPVEAVPSAQVQTLAGQLDDDTHR